MILFLKSTFACRDELAKPSCAEQRRFLGGTRGTAPLMHGLSLSSLMDRSAVGTGWHPAAGHPLGSGGGRDHGAGLRLGQGASGVVWASSTLRRPELLLDTRAACPGLQPAPRGGERGEEGSRTAREAFMRVAGSWGRRAAPGARWARCPLSCVFPEERRPHMKARWLRCSSHGKPWASTGAAWAPMGAATACRAAFTASFPHQRGQSKAEP